MRRALTALATVIALTAPIGVGLATTASATVSIIGDDQCERGGGKERGDRCVGGRYDGERID
ncbi:hypothetical protein ACFYXC_36310 [Streptomyces sp. NPDC002701]|uniref:hypothetical protein n=1 Tax=Streptomyces sp. NPDC002701 TaxID=3364661 RepID=UPI0036BD6570